MRIYLFTKDFYERVLRHTSSLEEMSIWACLQQAGIAQLPLCRPEKAQLKRHAAIENSKIGNWDK